jgi:hypothetical protein
MTYVVALLTTLALSGPALAQQLTPPGAERRSNGGCSRCPCRANDLRQHDYHQRLEGNKPVAAKGFTASALVSRGLEREMVALVPRTR